MAAKKRKSTFANKVATHASTQESSGKSVGCLKLPNNLDFWNPTPGADEQIDILPYEVSINNHPDKAVNHQNKQLEIALKGDLWYRFPYLKHRQIGANNENVICPKTFGKKCPICEHRQKILNTEGRNDETDALRPSLRNLYLVKPINPEKEADKKIMLWEVAQTNFQETLNIFLKKKPQHEIFPDLYEGLTLDITFKSETFGNSKPFAKATIIDFVEREEQYDDSILDKLPCLDSLVAVKSYEEIKKIFYEEEDIEMEEEKDEAPFKEDEKEEKEEAQDTEEKEEAQDTEEKETPSRRRRKSTKEEEKKEGKEEECPKGYNFGHDWDLKDECQSCELFDSCGDKFDELEEQGEIKK